MFDVNDRSSLHGLSHWLEIAREGCSRETVFMVIGGMIDCGDRKVTESEGADWASENSLLYGEVSALTGEGTEEALDAMLREILSLHVANLPLDSPPRNE
jgi:GTPase SAR1 family protein